MMRGILVAALIAGTLTGILFTAIQHLQVIPLIQKAEIYESGNNIAQHNHAQHEHTHTKDDNNELLDRYLFTLLANVLAGIGFSLLLAGAITLSKQAGWQKGLLWGVAGYLSFYVAPALGLTPKLPGTLGAPIGYQQLWWIATVISTATGLCLLIFSRHISLKAVGLVIMAIPHIYGAPLPEQAYSSAPVQLRHNFVVASALANAAFWIMLGFLSGYLLRKTETAI